MRTLSSARAHRLLRLQRRDTTAQQLHLGDVAAAHARLVQRDDLVEARGILARERQILLCELQVDERLLHLELQRANRIEDLGLGDRALFLREADAAIAFGAAFQRKVDAHAVPGGPAPFSSSKPVPSKSR